MSKILRSLAFLIVLLGLCGLVVSPAEARTYHKKHHKAHHTAHRIKAHPSAMVRTAQMHLTDLGYYKNKIDGLTGPKTTAAIRRFQHVHHMHVTGKLTTQTYNALVEADIKAPSPFVKRAPRQTPTENLALASPLPLPPPKSDFYETHPDFYGHYDQAYAEPFQNPVVIGGSGETPDLHAQTLPNRFATINASEESGDHGNHYTVTLNGEPLLNAEDQPSVIGISRTFALDNEDAIIFSTYHDHDLSCAYRHYLLTLHEGDHKMQEIGNCTRGYQAKINNHSLFIIFPESDDARMVGSTWRYDNGDLERL